MWKNREESVPGSQLHICWLVGVNSKAQSNIALCNWGNTTVYLQFSEVLSEFVELFAHTGPRVTYSQWHPSSAG